MALRKLRTAVLVVHGMGSQRPLETVSGIVNAVWFDNDDHITAGQPGDDGKQRKKRIWSHPQPSGVDLDLTVMTTNEIEGTPDRRRADFHELYWAHHMSETKAVAVLLWLFELGRRGPHLGDSLNRLWWCIAVFLCLLLLSVSLIVFRIVAWIANVAGTPGDILVTMMVALLIALLGGLAHVMRMKLNLLRKALVDAVGYWLAAGSTLLLVIAVFAIAGWLFRKWVSFPESLSVVAGILLPIGTAFLGAWLLMGESAIRPFRWAMALSLLFLVMFVFGEAVGHGKVVDAIFEGHVPWSMASDWSVIAAFLIIGIYLAVNAAFLQPYLGDAARYFRNSPANVAVRRAIRKDAVDTLDQLHRSRDYDRIVVVAHSLGTVVAYDMLRAYYGRICRQVPIDALREKFEFQQADRAPIDCDRQRKLGRELVRELARTSGMLAPEARDDDYMPAAPPDVDAWLVTDFVTLGSPLTHARFLFANEDDGSRIDQEFEKRVRERELPTCPPRMLDNDGRLSFEDRAAGKFRLHHGGMFGLTRWTNLYFPAIETFWGDAIGGPLKPVFGECVHDEEVWTDCARNTDGFKHTSYWKTDCHPDRRNGLHIAALREAVNLADK